MHIHPINARDVHHINRKVYHDVQKWGCGRRQSPTTPLGMIYSKPESHTGPKVVTIAVSTVHTASMIRTF